MIAAPRETATSTHVVNEKTSMTIVTSAGARAVTALGPHSHRHDHASCANAPIVERAGCVTRAYCFFVAAQMPTAFPQVA